VKAIGIIVLLLLGGLGTATVLLTREPDRTLDPQGQVWVADYRAWHGSVARQVDAARRELRSATPQRNVRLLEPLRSCARRVARLGEPPDLLEDVRDAALQACAEAEFALAKNDRFGVSALATTDLHLGEVEDGLRLAERELELALDGSP
jgi:hypothetical protein